MLRLIHPFLYDGLISRILADSTQQRVLLYGGRGLGKTTLLRRLQARVVRATPATEHAPTWVDKRTPKAAKVIAKWCLTHHGYLIIDDFEQVFTPEVDNALLSLPDSDDGRFRVVVASRKPPRVLERDVLQARVAAGDAHATPWDDSRAIPTFTATRLNPWEGDWKTRLEVAHTNAMQRLRKELRARVPEGSVDQTLALLPDRTALAAWVELVRRTTGGQPRLVDGAHDLFLLLLLNDLVAQAGLPADDSLLLEQRKRSRLSTTAGLSSYPLDGRCKPKQFEEELRDMLQLLEDYLLERQMVDLDRTLDHLRVSDPDAFGALQALAELPDKTVVEDGRHRLLLLDTGVVYKDDDSRRLCLPHGLVSEAIRAMDPPTQQAPKEPKAETLDTDEPAEPTLTILSFTVSEGPTEDSGDVVVETSDGTRVVSLRGRPWQVFDYFWKHRDRHVPPDELMEPLEIPSIHSARNAILRLNQALKKEGVGAVLENKKGVGYLVNVRS